MEPPWSHPGHRVILARARRDRHRPHRRCAQNLFLAACGSASQIARNLVTEPRLAPMDEPTGGLPDTGAGAPGFDFRGSVAELGLAAVVVTHDLAVARLLSHRDGDEGWPRHRDWLTSTRCSTIQGALYASCHFSFP